MCMDILCMCISVPCVCLLIMDARKEYYIPWGLSYRWLWADMVLGRNQPWVI